MEIEEYRDVSMDLIEPEPITQLKDHFKLPLDKAAGLIVDEAYALNYADVVADIKALERTKDLMKPNLLRQRAGKEKSTAVGKALLCFNEVDAQTGIDWEAAFKAMVGDPQQDPGLMKDLAQYKKVTRAGYVSVEVKKL